MSTQGTFPLLSVEWCNMAKTLGRIAEVSEAEVGHQSFFWLETHYILNLLCQQLNIILGLSLFLVHMLVSRS